ncbi:MAG TPA: hypothetical protein VK176_02330 [Phycisphaerales bacterium]|nr:hypothetical protein [Phycisphaerales bacterium]
MIIILCTLLLQPSSASQDALAAWLRDVGERGPHRPADLVYEIRIEEPAQRTPQDVRALAAAVKDKPDHPLRDEVRAEERRLAEGPDITDVVIFWNQEGSWRYNITLGPWADAAIRFIDTCVRPDSAWRLTPEQLAIVDPPSGYPPGRDYAANQGTFLNYVDAMLDGSLSRRVSGMKLEEASVINGAWTARFSRDGRVIEYSGMIVQDPRAGGIFEPHSWKVVSHPEREFVGEMEHYERWAFDEAIGQRVAHTVRFVRSDGAPSRTVTLAGARRLGRDEFHRISRIPEPGEKDPIRGDVRITRVFDVRPGAMEVRFPQDDVRPSMPLSPAATGSRSSQVAGAIAACAIVAALVWLRLRRASR